MAHFRKTPMGAGRTVTPPLFDGSKLITTEWPTTASNVSTHYNSSRVSVPYYSLVYFGLQVAFRMLSS